MATAIKTAYWTLIAFNHYSIKVKQVTVPVPIDRVLYGIGIASPLPDSGQRTARA